MYRVLLSFCASVVILSADAVTDGKERASQLLNNIKSQASMEIQEQWLPEKYKHLPEIVAESKRKEPVLAITYLTSSSVPLNSHISYAKQASRLKEEFNVAVKMCMIGIESKAFEPFITEVMGEISKNMYSPIAMDFCPDLFESLKVDRVPAYAISVCDRGDIHPEECKVRYVIRGDISLKYAIEKLSENNQYFKEFLDAL